MIVTIDGPAGSGKSSTAKAVARQTGWHYLDSGALYRTFTLIYIRSGADDNRFEETADNHEIELSVEGRRVITLLDGKEMGDEIRTKEVSGKVSHVAAIGWVRDRVNRIMREAAEKYNFIADGRDLGSVVFPEARLKFFMVADPEVRAKRRFEEMKENGMNPDYDEVLSNIKSRDKADSGRKIAPLTEPEGAIRIDTTSLAFKKQVELIAEKVKSV